MTIQAIETKYNGYRFRSRLEARWAVFFDTLGIRYEYEKEGYDLHDTFYEVVTYQSFESEDYFIGRGFVKGGHYLPDFWLPDNDAFVEIKGETVSSASESKAIALAYHSNKYVYVCSGNIGEDVDIRSYIPGHHSNIYDEEFSELQPIEFLECICCHKIVIASIDTPAICTPEPCQCYGSIMPIGGERGWGDAPCIKRPYRITDRVRSAYTASRSARFEHGETPKVQRGRIKKEI